MPLCERDKGGGSPAQKPFMLREGFEAQAAGSRIKLFLLLRCNVTISINYRSCSVRWSVNPSVVRPFLQVGGAPGDDFDILSFPSTINSKEISEAFGKVVRSSYQGRS